jgi:dephospho-CoA kinase
MMVPVAPVIGLTGGIAMGKSLVAAHLADHHGWLVLDADVHAREAVELGSPVLQRLADRYPGILQADGRLDRSQLGEIIFANPAERQWVEQQIHPFVRDRMTQRRDRHQAQYPAIPVVWVVPLLFEADLTGAVDRIWVVRCDRAQQLQRLMSRNGLSEAQAAARIASQWPIEQKCQQADCVFDNSTTPAALLEQVDHAASQVG